MSNVKHPLLACDGWPFFLGGIFFLLFALGFNQLWLSILCVIYLSACFILFRDPYRQIPSLPLAVVSPVDGVIENISRIEEGLLLRSATVVRIRVIHSGAYTTRSPTEGKIMSLSDAEAGSRMIETGGLWIRTDEGEDVVMQMKSSGVYNLYPAIADVRYGERVGQGQRVGLNRLTQYTLLYLPENTKLSVVVGQNVYAATTVLAEYYRERDEEE